MRFCAHKLFGWQIFQDVLLSHIVLNALLPEVNQIIRNNQRTNPSNLNAIQPMVHKISRHFFQDVSAKIIWEELPRHKSVKN